MSNMLHYRRPGEVRNLCGGLGTSANDIETPTCKNCLRSLGVYLTLADRRNLISKARRHLRIAQNALDLL